MPTSSHLVRRAALVLAFTCSLGLARTAHADTLTLMWDLNDEPEVTGYIVYVGTQSGVYTHTVDVEHTDTYVFDGATPGQRYYFAVAAYAGSLVSPLSEEVSGFSNEYPTLVNPGPQSTTAGTAVSLQLQGADPRGEAIAYSATGLPTGLMLSKTLGLISGIATAPGSYTVTVTVSDGLLIAMRSFAWTVVSGNAAPTLAAPGHQSGTVGQAVSLPLQGADPDGDALTYAATGLPTGLSLAPGTGTIAGTLAAAGTYPVTVTVGDGSLIASQSFVWLVTAPNVAPTLAAPGNQSSTAGVATELQLVGADANGDALTYTASGLPGGLHLTPASGRIAGAAVSAGKYAVTVTVSDGALTASQSFTWTVHAGNTAPTLAAPGSPSSTVGQPAVLQLLAADANGDTITYWASGLPTGMQLTPSTGRIAGTPVAAGEYVVTVTVSDGLLTTSRSFIWRVAGANVAPVLTAPSSQSSVVGQPVTLQLQASDANGDTLTWSATGLPSGLTVAPGTGRISGTPGTVGTSIVLVTVSDGALLTQGSFVWSVLPALVSPDPGTGTGTNEETPAPNVSTRAAARRASANAVYAGTSAVVRSTSDGQSPETSGRVFTGTAALQRTPSGSQAGGGGGTAPIYTGTAALTRSVVDPGAARSGGTQTGTGALIRIPQEAPSLTGRMDLPQGGSLSMAQGAQALAPHDADGEQHLTGGVATSRPADTVTAPDAPVVRIETPVHQAEVAGMVIFAGTAQDAAGTTLSSGIAWSSDRDGALGTGALFHTALSSGTHVVTAMVTDAGGRTQQAQVTVVVE